MRWAIGSPDGMFDPAGKVGTFFHVGVVVADIEAAMAELGEAMGVEWSGPIERDVGEWVVRAAFARTPPPYLELIEGQPGSVWDATSGAGIHHLSYWSDDLDSASSSLETAGMPLEFDIGVARYHRGEHSGTRVELLDSDARPAFFERWGLPQ